MCTAKGGMDTVPVPLNKFHAKGDCGMSCGRLWGFGKVTWFFGGRWCGLWVGCKCGMVTKECHGAHLNDQPSHMVQLSQTHELCQGT